MRLPLVDNMIEKSASKSPSEADEAWHVGTTDVVEQSAGPATK